MTVSAKGAELYIYIYISSMQSSSREDPHAEGSLNNNETKSNYNLITDLA